MPLKCYESLTLLFHVFSYDCYVVAGIIHIHRCRRLTRRVVILHRHMYRVPVHMLTATSKDSSNLPTVDTKIRYVYATYAQLTTIGALKLVRYPFF